MITSLAQYPSSQEENVMSIIFHESSKTLTLHTANTTYQMQIVTWPQ